MSNRASDDVACYYCGHSISAARPGRLDVCPECGKYLHVCRMCAHYDPAETSKQCTEDDAEKVQDKQAANFCEYFTFSDRTFNAGEITAHAKARSELSALFGDDVSAGADRRPVEPDEALKDAEALFRK